MGNMGVCGDGGDSGSVGRVVTWECVRNQRLWRGL